MSKLEYVSKVKKCFGRHTLNDNRTIKDAHYFSWMQIGVLGTLEETDPHSFSSGNHSITHQDCTKIKVI